MTKKAQEVAEGAENECGPLFDAVRKVLLAGIGAVALAQDEIEDFVHKLVERGEIAEKDGKKLVRDLLERRKKERSRAGKELDQRVGELLQRMNVPTRADLETLSAKIADLNAKVDKLTKS
jgi:poly(hydroxyalkanoate) granule-associated protein